MLLGRTAPRGLGSLVDGRNLCSRLKMPPRRLLLVVPALPPVRVTRERPIRHNPLFTLPYLGLLSIGALTPSSYDIVLVNEHVRPIDFEQPADLVGITVMTPLAPRAYEIAAEFRRRGARVVLGGLHPTNVPNEARQHADAIVRGYVEGPKPSRTSNSAYEPTTASASGRAQGGSHPAVRQPMTPAPPPSPRSSW